MIGARQTSPLLVPTSSHTEPTVASAIHVRICTTPPPTPTGSEFGLGDREGIQKKATLIIIIKSNEKRVGLIDC